MITRRSFVKTIGALGATSGFSPLLSAKNAPDLPPGNDYKALVCIFLQGGNDSFNMLIPSDLSLYNEYADARKGGNNGDDNISVSKNVLDLPDLTNSKLSSSPILMQQMIKNLLGLREFMMLAWIFP